MKNEGGTLLPDIVRGEETDLLAEWLQHQTRTAGIASRLTEDDLREKSRAFLRGFSEAAQGGNVTDIDAPEWAKVRDVLLDVSKSGAREGLSPAQTATFVFSLKQPLFARIAARVTEPVALAAAFWNVTVLIDQLGLRTTELYQKGREEVINRQQRDILELSTPVVKLWEGIVALPLIGALDSERTQVVMETLLEQIVSNSASIAIIDITGVPTVDTLVAQHLLKAVAAARLMGAECIISGIRPQIAQTMVHLGVELHEVVTKATLADAFAVALRRTSRRVVTDRAVEAP
ncbi:MAG TPA: STAS domain-containing protein, partial [Thermoanaerobaculia bacterium]|nr:STAS domain-containing protein [Thermoanaerobaculia bacterium]